MAILAPKSRFYANLQNFKFFKKIINFYKINEIYWKSIKKWLIFNILLIEISAIYCRKRAKICEKYVYKDQKKSFINREFFEFISMFFDKIYWKLSKISKIIEKKWKIIKKLRPKWAVLDEKWIILLRFYFNFLCFLNKNIVGMKWK